jgi:hypothetical protein
MDIVADGPILALGKGWYPLEKERYQVFRWAAERADFRLAILDEAPYQLVLHAEPGPGVELKSFLLSLFDDDDQPLGGVQFAGRERVTFDIPALRPGVHRFTLRAEGGGKRIAGDPRSLDFRVFEFRAVRGELDIVPPMVRLLEGWYPLETFNGETFRWVANDASLRVPEGQPPFDVEVESGPGLEYGPFPLEVRGNGDRSIVTVQRRQTVRFPAGGEYTLHVNGGGKTSAGDPRVLNFRVFRAD